MKSEDDRLIGRWVNLRALTPEDAERTFRWRNGIRARHLNPGSSSIDAQVRCIESRPADEYNWIIELKRGDPVGMLSLVAVDIRNSRAETGRFLIGEEEKAKGVPVAVEAMSLLYRFAFETLRLSRLYGTIAAGNERMVKWQKYLGMKEEGLLRNHYRTDNGFQDAVFLGILRDEYETIFLSRAKALISMGASSASHQN